MGFEISLLFAFGAMVCWGFGDFFIQRCTRKIGDIESLAYIGIIGSIILVPFILKDVQLIFSVSNMILLLVLGILTFIVALFDFEALKKGKLSIIDVIIELELPVTIILGFIFFKESLSIAQFSIVSLIFISVIMMATKSLGSWKVKLERGVLIALIAAVGMGVVNFLTAISSKSISPLMAVWIPWLIFSVLCFIFIVKQEGLSKFIKNGIRFKWIVLFMGVFDTLAWIFYAFAVSKNEIAITTAITESYPAIALFLGVWLNKERIHGYQYLGAVLAIVASFILAIL
ncbi:MAG: DMT family transporter [Nanoarchaeota archaeon]|nr:DMT family transporter [Nanoarchaeota archaeon]